MSRWHYYMKTLGISYINVGTKDREVKIAVIREILELIYSFIIEYNKHKPAYSAILHKRTCDLYNTIARALPK